MMIRWIRYYRSNEPGSLKKELNCSFFKTTPAFGKKDVWF